LRREFGFLASALLLGLFIISAVSLAASLRSIDVSELLATSSVGRPSVPTLQQPAQVASVTGSGSVVWLIVAAVAIASLVLLFLIRRRKSLAGGLLFWRLLGATLGITVFIVFVELLKGAVLSIGGAQQELVSTTDILFLAGALAVVSAIAAFAWFERSRIIATSASLEESPVQNIKKILESVRRRIYSMPQSEVYRDSVIACYSAMTRLLAKYGARDRPSFTPQELESSASESLAFAGTDIHLLTKLFEKARYADAPVTRREAEDSADALERMTNETAASVVQDEVA
jgi:LPXTG-motif cell wall-anchored protein